MIEDKDVTYWTCDDDAEVLGHGSISEAVTEWIDEQFAPDDPLPEEIDVYGYVRVKVRPSECGQPLQYVLEWLDEEYGNPYKDEEPTEGMKEAEKVFIEAVLKEYVPWACERVTSKIVKVEEYYDGRP